jgi:hypothetical protein
MTTRQRERRLLRRQQHTIIQRRKREQALLDATSAALTVGKDGQPLKRPRKDDALWRAILQQMELRNYVPDGRGGWRTIHKRSLAKQMKRRGEGAIES